MGKANFRERVKAKYRESLRRVATGDEHRNIGKRVVPAFKMF